MTPYARNISPTEGAGRGGNVTASPLNDINPNDIDRIEVLKGSAASTLYGTEAAAGVIQIFTKRGTTGAPRWTMQIDQGFNHEMPFAPDVDVRPVNDPTLSTIPRGQYSYKYLNMDPWLRDGYRQKYSLSVSGGSQVLQYYVSGQYDGNQGVMPLDDERKAGDARELHVHPPQLAEPPDQRRVQPGRYPEHLRGEQRPGPDPQRLPA